MRKNVLLRESLSGWGLGGVTAMQTGFPVAFSESSIRSGWCDGYSYFGCSDVPETSTFNIQKLNPRSPGSPYFSASSFSLGTFGNTSRNFFHGPGFNYTNLNISKNIHLGADAKRFIQLQLETFNTFNHANFAPPTGELQQQRDSIAGAECRSVA
jgi:hypothetical protein